MDYPSGLGRNPVQILALNVYVLSHHILPRASFHLETRQEYFFYDQESFDMLKTGFGGTWFSTLLAPLLLIFCKGNGPKWGTWPTTAPFCPIFVAMIFFIGN
jgi:hypothetical protein